MTSALIPISIDSDTLFEYREEFEWACEEIETLLVDLETSAKSEKLTNALSHIKNLISELQISSFKIGLIPLSEILNDIIQVINLLFEIKNYPVLMSEFLLLVIDRISLLIKDAELYSTIDINKTQSILIATQKILSPVSSSLPQMVIDAIEIITREININLDNPAAADVTLFDDVELFDDVVLFSSEADQGDIAIISTPKHYKNKSITIQKESNPMIGAQQLIKQFYETEKTATLLSIIADNGTLYRSSHTYFLLEIALTVNMLAGKIMDEQTLFTSFCLHDLSLASIPHITKKEGELTDEEFELIKLHPFEGSRIAKDLGASVECQLTIAHHHERLDGSGYPLQIKGDEISEGGKLLGIIDSFHAMTHNRPYKKITKTVLRAMSEINACVNTRYDKHWVKYFNLCIRDYWLKQNQENNELCKNIMLQ